MVETLERLRDAGWRVEFGAKTPFLPAKQSPTVSLKHWQYGTFYGGGDTVEHALETALLEATVAWGLRAS